MCPPEKRQRGKKEGKFQIITVTAPRRGMRRSGRQMKKKRSIREREDPSGIRKNPLESDVTLIP